jgi:hypothetical protein
VGPLPSSDVVHVLSARVGLVSFTRWLASIKQVWAVKGPFQPTGEQQKASHSERDPASPSTPIYTTGIHCVPVLTQGRIYRRPPVRLALRRGITSSTKVSQSVRDRLLVHTYKLPPLGPLLSLSSALLTTRKYRDGRVCQSTDLRHLFRDYKSV